MYSPVTRRIRGSRWPREGNGSLLVGCRGWETVGDDQRIVQCVTCPVGQGKIVRRVKIVLWEVIVEQDSNARIHGCAVSRGLRVQNINLLAMSGDT